MLYLAREAKKVQGNEFEMWWCEALVMVHILREHCDSHVEGYHIALVDLGRHHHYYH